MPDAMAGLGSVNRKEMAALRTGNNYPILIQIHRRRKETVEGAQTSTRPDKGGINVACGRISTGVVMFTQ